MQILKGHTSPETAYSVPDYPFGFRLRCTMRYWIDCDPKRGARMMMQTSNPKKPGLVWNKPKATTYSRFAGAMYLDEKGHVQFTGLTEYTDAAEALAWRETYGEGCPEVLVPTMDHWCKAKVAYEKLRDAGKIAITITTTERVL